VVGEVAEGGGADEVFELSPDHLVDVVTCPFVWVDFYGVSGCHVCITYTAMGYMSCGSANPGGIGSG
jgi:hypothetical protein